MSQLPPRADIERHGFLLFLALITLALVYVAWPFIIPILWAALAAIMFQPLYRWFLLKRPDSPNQCALATLLVILFAVLLPAIWLAGIVVEQAGLILAAFQRGEIDIAAWFRQIFDALPARLRLSLRSEGLGDFANVQARIQDLITESAGMIAQRAVAIGGSALSGVLAFGVGLYVTYFLLRDGREVAAAVIRALPLEPSISAQLTERFVAIVRATIKGSGIVAVAQGLLGAITFWIAGLPSVAIFGVLMAVFSLLPAIGPAIVWIPAAIWLLATGAIWQGIVVIVSGVAVIGLVDNALRPILVGRDTGIPDWIILVTTLGGIAVAGISGIVVGPLVAGLFLAGWGILSEQRSASLH